jgi:carboxylesterase type B
MQQEGMAKTRITDSQQIDGKAVMIMGNALLAVTESGMVSGVYERGMAVFKGIPYAEPPVGKRRFKPPVPRARWEGVYQAHAYGPRAIQQNREAGHSYSEDCLNLNIWTPAADNGKRPVIFFIHGGGHVEGSNSDGFAVGQGLLRGREAVMVSVNYRLGALGYLYLGELLGDAYATSGNNGLLDQLLALQWVRKNIAAFGGDPDRITLMGHSAGAKSVAALMVTPGALGLYRQAIIQSGGPQCVRDQVTAAQLAKLVTAGLGLVKCESGGTTGKFEEDESNEVVEKAGEVEETGAAEEVGAVVETEAAEEECRVELAAEADHQQGSAVSQLAERLLAMPVEQILAAQIVAYQTISSTHLFGPVVDGIVLKEEPAAYVAAGHLRGVPVLIGYARDEVSAGPVDPGFDASAIADKLFYTFGVNGERLLDPYRELAAQEEHPSLAYGKLLTRYMYANAAMDFTKMLAEHGARVWSYRWDYSGHMPPGHGSEMAYLFDVRGNGEGDGYTPPHSAMAELLSDIWLSFILSGSPQVPQLPEWPICTSGRAGFQLHLDRDIWLEPLSRYVFDEDFPLQVVRLTDRTDA